MNELKQWEEATTNLANYFIAKYFGKDTDNWWISQDIGGTLCINDYFFNLSDIVDFLKYKYSKKKMFEYYEYALAKKDKTPVNIQTWIKIK